MLATASCAAAEASNTARALAGSALTALAVAEMMPPKWETEVVTVQSFRPCKPNRAQEHGSTVPLTMNRTAAHNFGRKVVFLTTKLVADNY